MINDNTNIPPSDTALSSKPQHVPNQSISSNTDRSTSPLLVSPTSPPLVELSPSQVHSLTTSNPSSQSKPNEKIATKAKSRPNPNPGSKTTNHKKTTSTVNQGTRFPAHTNTGERQCTNCSEIDTPQWRGTLCNACALWKRSRGTDRPLPLLFPVKRRSPTPEDDDDLTEESEEEGDQNQYQTIHNNDQMIRLTSDRYDPGRRGSNQRELSPRTRISIGHDPGRRKFWVDRRSRANSENPSSYQMPAMMQAGSQNPISNNRESNMAMRPRLRMGIIRGGLGGGRGHAHGRTMSYQPSTHNRSSSLSHSQPFPNLSIVPPNSQSQQLSSSGHSNPPQTGRIQGVHSTPVSPTHHINQNPMNHDHHRPSPYGHNHLQEPDIKPSLPGANDLNHSNLQNRIANIMSQVQNPDEEKRKRRNSSPTAITTPKKRSYSSPPLNSHNHTNHRRDESEEIRSPYLPYSLDKRGKSKLSNMVSTVGQPHVNRATTPELFGSNQDKQRHTVTRSNTENEQDGAIPDRLMITSRHDNDDHDLDIGLTKDEFLRGAEWLFDILQSTSKLLSRSLVAGQGHPDETFGPSDGSVENDTQNNEDYNRTDDDDSSQNQDRVRDGFQGGLDILGKVAEEEYNKVNLT